MGGVGKDKAITIRGGKQKREAGIYPSRTWQPALPIFSMTLSWLPPMTSLVGHGTVLNHSLNACNFSTPLRVDRYLEQHSTSPQWINTSPGGKTNLS